MKSLSQMTEKELKTLCKSLESRYSENATVTIKQADFNNMWASIDSYAKEIKRLQEQLESAQDVIYEYIKIYGVERECSKYLEKYAKRTK